jgi:hypothetical protein
MAAAVPRGREVAYVQANPQRVADFRLLFAENGFRAFGHGLGTAEVVPRCLGSVLLIFLAAAIASSSANSERRSGAGSAPLAVTSMRGSGGRPQARKLWRERRTPAPRNATDGPFALWSSPRGGGAARSSSLNVTLLPAVGSALPGGSLLCRNVKHSPRFCPVRVRESGGRRSRRSASPVAKG